MSNVTIKYGIHNGQVKVYAVVNKVRKKRSLSYFGAKYTISTSTVYWNKKEEHFLLYIDNKIPIPTSSEDNRKLEELKRILNKLAENREFRDSDDFFNSCKTFFNEENYKIPTLIEYAKVYSRLWKENKVMGKCYKYESGNYVIYNKFVRRLQGYQYKKLQSWASEIQIFSNMPISEIGNKEYNDFVYFLVMHNLPIKDSLNAFRAIVYYYRRWVMNDDSFKFQLKEKYKGIVQNSKKKKRQSITLTSEQLRQLKHFDIRVLKGESSQKQLYKDTLLLMYGLVTRPFDILSMKIEDIKVRKGKLYYWVYCANKLRNTKGRKDETPIQPGCWDILSKYIGDRKQGFVLPFAMNNEEKPQQQRKIQVNHTATKIGNFLKEIAKYYSWDVDIAKVSMYTLRHTAITDLLKHYSCNIVAAWAHTSVKEINDTYEDRQNLATSVFPDNFNLIK